MQKILHLGFLIPPPQMQKNTTYFFKLLASFWATLEKIIFSPWKTQKYLENFHKIGPQKGVEDPPWPPSQREKFFFAFLDELDHSTHF